ncbi:MAG: hypothetical protein KKD77_21285 [Gammaproteobacteria bacterium]|nr:hypothetical protein [Gammaproteobacteria bacterium]
MALKTVSIGTAQDVYQFDDGDTEYGVETDGKIKVDTAPTNPNEVLRLADIPTSANIVTAAANITDHAVVRGDGGTKGIQDSLVTIDDAGSISLLALQTVDGRDVSVDGLKLDGIAAGANLYVHPNHSGEVTSLADGAQTIAADAVTYAKMQNVSAADKILGRVTAGAGDVEEIACTAAGRALLDDANAAAQATTLGVGAGDSPTHVTVKLSGLTDGKVPKHTSDAVGLEDSPITVSGVGEVTNASQPGFLAVPSGDLLNVTGDGTPYTVVFATVDHNVGSHFDGVSTYTASITGIHDFDVLVTISGLLTNADNMYVNLVTTGRTFSAPLALNTGNSNFYYTISFTISVSIYMTVGQTAHVIAAVGTMGATADILAASSHFSGHLVC